MTDAEDPTPILTRDEDSPDLLADVYDSDFAYTPGLFQSDGWIAPHGLAYELFPEVTVSRGGITFSTPKSLTKKQLRARLAVVEPALAKERKLRRKAERKVRRLLKIIEGMA